MRTHLPSSPEANEDINPGVEVDGKVTMFPLGSLARSADLETFSGANANSSSNFVTATSV
tara:strand:- start:785 stop:964 length:180 start_codon:yes stop_codon:yes gene_type:complete